jgi:hypothetical protein
VCLVSMPPARSARHERLLAAGSSDFARVPVRLPTVTVCYAGYNPYNLYMYAVKRGVIRVVLVDAI